MDEIIKHLYCFFFPYWTLQWFFLIFKNLRSYRNILYGLPVITFVLSFFMEEKYPYFIMLGCIGFLVLSFYSIFTTEIEKEDKEIIQKSEMKISLFLLFNLLFFFS